MQDSSEDFYHNIKSTPPTRIILPEAVSLNKKASFLAASDLVITSRLHAGLIAISHGVPTILLQSTPKIEFFARELGLESFFFKRAPKSSDLDTIINYDSLSEILFEKSEHMRLMASVDLI
jgi:polysaccharide pyruvyl transferase WcaK-like protein